MNRREVLGRAIKLAISKDGRTTYKIARELGIDRGAVYRMRDSKLFPNTERYLKIKKWLLSLDIDIEKDLSGL